MKNNATKILRIMIIVTLIILVWVQKKIIIPYFENSNKNSLLSQNTSSDKKNNVNIQNTKSFL